MIVLKPQDVVILFKTMTTHNPDWTYASLSNELFISASEVHSAIKRASLAKLWDPLEKKILKRALEEFVIHGVNYAFPANYSGVTRGVATAFSAPPLNEIVIQGEFHLVWPDPIGQTRGTGLSPLYKSVPKAIQNDQSFYELLTLVDAIRVGSAREKKIAIDEIKKRISEYEP